MSRRISCWLAAAVASAAFAAEPNSDVLTKELLSGPASIAWATPPGDASLTLREVGQITWALELSGHGTEAEKLAEFGLRALDQSKDAERPAGSVPPAVQASGKSRLPRCYVDAHAVSAILEGAWRHASAMEQRAGSNWAARWWPQIAAGGDFVVNWTRGPRGEPYPAFEPALGRDAGGAFESPGALLGVLCAQNLAQLAGKPVPETWQQRREALEILVRTTDFTDALRAPRVPWGCADLRGILPAPHPFWLAQVILQGEPHAAREAAASGDSPASQIIRAKRKP